ncbi:MAG: ATP-binding protein [Candidatus Wallbacteria bacterium]|nr:ATP-binding protein [Candidatus Wallbacteria bacterium]
MRNLRSRISFLFLALFAIVILVFTIFLIMKVRSIYLERSLENTRLLTSIITTISSSSDSWENLSDNLDKVLDKLGEFADVQEVVIRQGVSVLYSYTSPWAESSPARDPVHYIRLREMSDYLIMKRSIQVKSPLQVMGKSGELVIRLSLEKIRLELLSIYINYAVISFIVFSLIYFITRFLSRIIVEPVKELANATRSIAGGDYREIVLRTDTELGDLVDSFNAMVRALSKTMEENKLALIGKMSAGLAHEIRNPLVSIKGLTEVLLEESEKPEFRKDLEIIVREVERLNLFIEQLLRFSRPAPTEFHQCCLRSIMLEVLQLCKHELKKTRLQVLETWEDLPMVQADPNSIKQVFLNLLFNAIQFSPPDGTIEIKGYSGNTTGDHIKIEISDKGPGIPPQAMEHIFEPFYSCRQGGCGLGLAIVRRIMQAHNGDVFLMSREGLGTTAVLFIPVGQGR